MPTVGTTHHVKLGNEYLIIRPNTYQKTPAPTFGARIASGDPDYNNLSIWQHWVQKCWIGGNGAEQWVDDAMFDYSYGVDTTEHEQARLSRDLTQPGTGNWGMGGNTDVLGFQFCTYGGVLYVLVMTGVGTRSRLYSYNGSTTWTSITLPAGAQFQARCIATFDGKLFISAMNTGTTRLYYATSPGTWTTVTNPAGVTQTIYAMQQYNGKLYVAYGVQVWRLKDDITWDGSTVFYKTNANSGSNLIGTMETHLGFLYMLSDNGHIHRTDGNNTFDIWSWDGQTRGISLRSYDGKLFVGTYEWDGANADQGYGVIYQFTGAAVTELKRWGITGKATVIGNMIVYGRKMYYGAALEMGARTGFAVGVYDAVEDAHSIWAAQPDVTTYPAVTWRTRDDTAGTAGVGGAWLVDDVIFFGGNLFCTVRGYGIFKTNATFQAGRTGLATYVTGTANGGLLVSSTYDAGTPGLQKLWRKITVFCDLASAAQSFILSYSLDGGATYTALTTVVGPTGAGGQTIFYLNNIRSTRMKWSISLRTTNASVSPVLRGVVVAYLPQPEPNWMWSFTIPVSDAWKLMDKTDEVKSTNALIAYLEGLFRTQTLVTFIDVDGVTWGTNGPGVLVYDINVVHFDVENPREADVRIRLLEAVETY